MIVETAALPSRHANRWFDRAYYPLLVILLAFIGWNYFFEIKNFPNYHGDESGFLNIPYRWCEYGDTRYPTAWSHSFGSDQVRRYPPPAAFVLRSQYHAAVGFSPMKSRIYSAILILATVFFTALFLRRWSGLAWWQQILVIGQLGLAPVMIYTARSTRFEQEILFLGWMGAVVLPSLIPTVTSRFARGFLWMLSGCALGWGANSHPFGAVFCLVGVWLLFTARRWHELDGLRLWQRLGLLAGGCIAMSIPTVVWITQSWDHVVGYAEMQRDLYSVREGELIDFYAAQPPCARLSRIFPKGFVARLNTLYSASYEDYFSYPVPQYRHRLLLEIWFVGQFLLIAAYFAYSCCRRFQNGHHWLHLMVLLALGFVGFQLWYPPATTYKVYTTFFINAAGGLVLWQIANRLAVFKYSWPVSIVLAGLYLIMSAFLLHYAVKHSTHLVRHHESGDYPNVSLDQEFAALKAMSHHLKIDSNDQVVYTSIESWIASGKDTHSLWESVMLGLTKPRSDADGVVFKNGHVNFKLTTSGGDMVSRFPTREERVAGMRELLAPLRLSGVILNDFTPDGAYSYYTRAADDRTILVGRMQRTQETVFQKAEFMTHYASRDPLELEPGHYLLCVWTDIDPGMATLEMSTRSVSEESRLVTVSAGPLATLVPIPLALDVTEATQVKLELKNNRARSSIERCHVYKLAP